MSLESEIRNVQIKKRGVLLVPILSSVGGGGIGYLAGETAERYNEELVAVENSFKEILTHYRTKEEEIEQRIDEIPGLNLWQKGYQKLFGEAQQTIGIETENHTKVPIEDISLQGLRLPDSYTAYPLLGITIGFAYGLMKVGNTLRRLKREEKILKLIK